MPHLRNEIIVDCPIDESFGYTSDLNHLVDRHPDVVASAQTMSGPIGVGKTFDVTFAFGPMRVPMVYTIVEYEPPRRFVAVGEGSVQRAVDEFTFAETSAGTSITVEVDLAFRGLMRWLGPLLGPMTQRSGRRAVEGLAEALASQAHDPSS